MRVSKGLALLGSFALTMLTGLIAAPAAHADYGGGAAKNVWQLEVSFNCNNQALCGNIFGGTGGAWIWGEFDQTVGANPSNTGDAQMTFCFHAQGFGGGAAHTSEDVSSWVVGSNGNFWITGGTDTDRFRGQVDVHPIWGDVQPDPNNPTVPASLSDPVDIGIPALPGTFHFNTAEVWGVSAPGVSAQVTIAYRPAH